MSATLENYLVKSVNIQFFSKEDFCIHIVRLPVHQTAKKDTVNALEIDAKIILCSHRFDFILVQH